MNARVAAILVLLLAVLGGGALLYQHQERARRPDNVATLGRTLFKDLKAADIAAIRIVEPNATLTLQRKEDRWTIAERADFPADLAKVREFVLKVIGLKVGQSEPLGAFIVGRKYFKREVDNPDKAIPDGRFVVLPGEAGTAYLVGDPLTQATTRTAEWIDRTSFQVEKVKTLQVRYPDGESWRIDRPADNAEWKLAGARPGEKLDVSRANAASYSLQLLELADVAPKGVTDTGLDKPTTIDATTLGGAAYAIKVGKLAGENYYVTFTSTATDKPNEKVLAPHVLLIPKSKLDDTLKKRADLLEKKEAKK